MLLLLLLLLLRFQFFILRVDDVSGDYKSALGSDLMVR